MLLQLLKTGDIGAPTATLNTQSGDRRISERQEQLGAKMFNKIFIS
jgi:hypothetical protein